MMATPSRLFFALRRPVVVAGVVGLLSAQPDCTLAGAGIGFAIDGETPGPYEQQPLAGSGEPVVRALQRLEVSPGDTVEVVLRDGAPMGGQVRGCSGGHGE